MFKQNQNLIRSANLESGMTIFIAIVVTSIMLFISFAVINITLKASLFSSSGRDSQYAFYAADAGIECALYFDAIEDSFNPAINGNSINCGGEIGQTLFSEIKTGDPLQGTSTTAIIGGDESALSSSDLAPSALAHYETLGAPSSAQTTSFDTHEDSIIVLGITYSSYYSPTVTEVRDLAGNTYNKIVSDNDYYLRAEMWYAKNPNPVTNNRITVVLNGPAWFFHLSAAEYTGLDFNSPLYDWADSINTGAPTAYTTSFDVPDKGLVVSFFALDKLSGSGSYSWTPEAGYNERRETQAGISMLQDKFYSANQSNISTSATASGSNPVPKISVTAVFSGDLLAASQVESNSIFGFGFDKSSDPAPYCSLVSVYKSGGNTTIKSRGYNTCDTGNPRRIERGVELTY